MHNNKAFPIPLWFILMIGIIAISFSSIFIRWSEAPVSIIAMYRLYITNLLMLPFIMKYWHELKKLSSKDWFFLSLSGLFLGLHFLFWMGSLRFTSVANSTAIVALEPIFVLIGSFLFFKQRTNFLAITGIIIAVLGAILIGWGDFGLSTKAVLGDMLALLGAITVAIHILIGKRLLRKMSNYVYSFFVFLTSAMLLNLYNIVQGYSFIKYSSMEWGIFILMAIIPTVFGHLLFNWLLKYMNATTVSMSILGEPLGAAILAYFLLNEHISFHQAIAGFILLLGVWIFIKFNQKQLDTKTHS
ncbi:DMT family transporter [Chengkuizengella axinellae]|uniref:DMT family transporter n=1 Tax=Chengkuizengella axinellae TaxID=3064388 RepID=A0ABT9J1S3_9BACL|nr:DMT family transporter [Chengkuizengella sp. 2205SS18-9]MDP5275559.1 DMT family transporter [Chengkuizengella sp. 2205SS18-9]